MSAPQSPGALLKGDVNLDGVADLTDIEAFARALADPAAWQQQYGHSLADLLAVADFDGDGQLTTADIDGFCAAILPPDAGGSLQGTSSNSMVTGVGDDLLLDPGAIDLDIDSDNDNGMSYPSRSFVEGYVEAEAPGKFIPVNDDDDDQNAQTDMGQSGAVSGEDDLVPLVLDLKPGTGVVPVQDFLTYRLDYPDDLRVWMAKDRGDPNMQILSDANQTERVWLRGDMNGDGLVNYADINPFIQCLNNFTVWRNRYIAAYTDMVPRAGDIGDYTNDGQINYADIDPFIHFLGTNGPPPPCIPVRLWVEGRSATAWGAAHITAEADTNHDGTIDENDAAPDVVYTTVTPLDIGVPSAWGAAKQISPFSSVNLQNGNIVTAIPLVGWAPVGPPVQFTLYHNTLANPYSTDYNAWGFSLGGGWSVSYGAHVVGTWGDDVVTVVGDDGARTVYTLADGQYVPPPGVHDTLTWDPNAQQWTLTSPGQSRAVFQVYDANEPLGRLIAIIDSAGNQVTIGRDGQSGHRIDYIASAR